MVILGMVDPIALQTYDITLHNISVCFGKSPFAVPQFQHVPAAFSADSAAYHMPLMSSTSERRS